MRKTHRVASLVSTLIMIFALAFPAFSVAASAAGPETYNHYYGLLHAHTGNSDGVGTYEDAYGMARQAGLDFFACTEHSDGMKHALDRQGDDRWAKGFAVADKMTKNGKFVAIMAYEMTWQGDVGPNKYGHFNAFNTRDYIYDRDPCYDNREGGIGLQNYYDGFAKLEGAIGQFDHPGRLLFGDFRGFAYRTPERDKNINLIEVGNGASPTLFFDFMGFIRNRTWDTYIRYERSYNLALAKGWHLGPTIGTDNHNANWGINNTHRTVLLAKKLTRPALYEAMSSRRCYATEDKNMKVDFTINGEVMGTIMDHSPAELQVRVKAATTTANIGRIMLIGEKGRVVRSRTFQSKTAEWEFSIPAEHKYYYIKICPSYTFTAPIWVKG